MNLAGFHLLRFPAIAFLTGMYAATAMAQSGCGTSNWSTCNDPVPVTFLSGSWIEDDSSSEWTLTANNGNQGQQGSVTGFVYVFAPPDAWSCPVFNYTAGGYYSPGYIIDNFGGTTSFTWTASNPTPNITCSGYTPVSGMTFQGTINNRGNDTGGGTWTNSSGLSGGLSIETNLILTPSSETVQFGGWVPGLPTVANFSQTLNDNKPYDPSDPYSDMFQGRQVYEETQTPGTDTCDSNGISPFAPFVAVTGGTWNVGYTPGNANTYLWDSVGFFPARVEWYQQNMAASLPCTATVPQQMEIVNQVPGQGNNQYASHTLSVTVYSGFINVSKDGLSETAATL
jgi:hypothetical protein